MNDQSGANSFRRSCLAQSLKSCENETKTRVLVCMRLDYVLYLRDATWHPGFLKLNTQENIDRLSWDYRVLVISPFSLVCLQWRPIPRVGTSLPAHGGASRTPSDTYLLETKSYRLITPEWTSMTSTTCGRRNHTSSEKTPCEDSPRCQN